MPYPHRSYLALIALLCIGCVAPAEGAAGSHVRVLLAEELDGVEVGDSGLRVPIDGSTALWSDEVAVGDVLVSETGLLREVVAVESDGGVRTLHTAPADMADALSDASIAQHSGNVYGKADVVDVDLGVHFAAREVTIHEDGPMSLRVREAAFDTWPTLDVETEMRRGEFTDVEVQLETTAEARLVVEVDILTDEAISQNVSYTLIETPVQHYVQWVGYVPIVESVQTRLIVDVAIEADANTDATLVVGTAATVTLTAGGRYTEEDGLVALRASKEKNLRAIGPELEHGEHAPRHLRVSLRPEVEVRFYEALGLTVGVNAYAETNVGGEDAMCGIEVGMSGDAAVDFSAFGIYRSRSTELFDHTLDRAACF